MQIHRVIPEEPILFWSFHATSLNQSFDIIANCRRQTPVLRRVWFDEFNRKLPIPQAGDILLQSQLVLSENLHTSGSTRNRDEPLLIVRGRFDG